MLGLSGFYPKFVKKYTLLDRIIEKAVKKYTKEDYNYFKFEVRTESHREL